MSGCGGRTIFVTYKNNHVQANVLNSSRYFLNSKHFYYRNLWGTFTFNWLIFLVFGHSGCNSHAFRETNSLRRIMQIVECSLLHWQAQCQGPRPAFVKIFYTSGVRFRTPHPNFLETYIKQRKGKYNHNNPIIQVLSSVRCSNS